MGDKTEMKVKLFPAKVANKGIHSNIETVHPDDRFAVSQLFYNGYKSTTHDYGHTLKNYQLEAKALLKGLYGPFLFDSSYIYKDGNQILSGAFVTLFKGIPLLIYGVTLPEHTNKGLFTQVLAQSMQTLSKKGYKELHLVVAKGNERAKRVYEKIGFREIN
ncbi:GNAT family N-acetyltransferase [Niallia nealsonii]|nr:GNAT family N-acetyltransferase [Niallia nealsonii]